MHRLAGLNELFPATGATPKLSSPTRMCYAKSRGQGKAGNPKPCGVHRFRVFRTQGVPTKPKTLTATHQRLGLRGASDTTQGTHSPVGVCGWRSRWPHPCPPNDTQFGCLVCSGGQVWAPPGRLGFGRWLLLPGIQKSLASPVGEDEEQVAGANQPQSPNTEDVTSLANASLDATLAQASQHNGSTNRGVPARPTHFERTIGHGPAFCMERSSPCAIADPSCQPSSSTSGTKARARTKKPMERKRMATTDTLPNP